MDNHNIPQCFILNWDVVVEGSKERLRLTQAARSMRGTEPIRDFMTWHELKGLMFTLRLWEEFGEIRSFDLRIQSEKLAYVVRSQPTRPKPQIHRERYDAETLFREGPQQDSNCDSYCYIL